MQDNLHERLSWDDIRVFLVLSRSRSLTEGGRKMGVDGSTMSRRLDTLEDALGAVLFERGRDGIMMTEAAERLKPFAEEMEAVAAQFAGTVQTFEREVAGSVRLACPGDAAQILVAPRLPELFRRHPALRVEIVPGEGMVDLARREADVALRTARPSAGDLVSIRLFTVKWCLAASPSLAKTVPCLRSWDELPWVGCGPGLARATPGRFWEEHLKNVEPVVVSDSLAVQVACVRSSVGVALLPEPSVTPFDLVRLSLGEELQRRVGDFPADELSMISHRALRRVPRVRALWEFLLEEASQGLSEPPGTTFPVP